MKSATIRELQGSVLNGLSSMVTPHGFSIHDSAFYKRTVPDVIQTVQPVYLNTQQATYFETCTASFVLTLGVYYTFFPPSFRLEPKHVPATQGTNQLFPKEYECHIRRCLLRDFGQQRTTGLDQLGHIVKQTGEDIRFGIRPLATLRRASHRIVGRVPEGRARKDIWFVEPDGGNLEVIVQGVKRAVLKDGLVWFQQFSDLPSIYQFLQRQPERDAWRGGAFGFGAKDSSIRYQFLGHFAKKLGREDEARVFSSKKPKPRKAKPNPFDFPLIYR